MANVGEISVALTLDDAGLRAGLDAAKAALEQFNDELAQLSFPAELTESATQAGLALALSLAEGTLSGEAPLRSASLELSDAALTALRSGAVSAPGIGRGFAAGLAEGIRAGRSGVVSAALDVARAAAEAARSALEIHSPSRVTRELGEFFDRGFIDGVERMRPDVERAVRLAVGVRAPGSAYGGTRVETVTSTDRSAAQPIDYDALAAAMDRRQLVLTLDGRRVAEIQRSDIARSQAAYSRRAALGYGSR